MSLNDLAGRKFGRLSVLAKSERPCYFVCKCDCGKIKEVRRDHLLTGKTKSCGCWKKDHHPWIYKGKPGRKRLNRIYSNMIFRCYDSRSDGYGRYGARGITVCDEWRESFNNFAEWSYANGYAENLTIDRIDNDKGYSPSNCRWITSSEQNNNKRTNVYLIIDGERYTVTQAARSVGLSKNKVFGWLYRGDSKEEVIQRLQNEYGFHGKEGEMG